MKILIPHATESVESGLKVTSKCLKLSEVTQGHHVGLVPMRLWGKNKSFERLYRIEVSSEASDNGKGYRRVMLKVSIPYHRIWTADPAAAASMQEKQEAASAGSISMHIVVSIPSRVRQDLIESSDTAATRGAEGHLAVVGALLSALTSQIRKLTLVQSIDSETGGLVSNSPTSWLVDDEGSAIIDAEETVQRLDSTTKQLPIVDCFDSSRFGAVGLAVDGGDHEFLSQNPRDPLVRGLFGLVPIEENTNIVAGPSILLRESQQ